MRFDYDYLQAIKGLINGIIIKFKPLSVHTEVIVDDEVWEKVRRKVLNKEVEVWHVMTPANYDYFKTNFNIKMSKEKISKIMAERYKWMIDKGERLELHIHLSILKNMDYEEQEKVFEESIKWVKDKLNIKLSEFVPGWWLYDENTVKLLKRYNLKLIKPSDYNYLHDYNWILMKR